MNCTKCQTPIDETEHICPICGQKVKTKVSKAKINICLVCISIIAIVFVVGLYNFAINKSNVYNQANVNTSRAVKQEPPYDINLKPQEFKKRWNMFEQKDIKRNLQMVKVIKQDYKEHEVHGYLFGPTLMVGLTVNKSDGYIRNVVIFGRPTTDDELNSNIFCALLLMTRAANPEITEKERQGLIFKLLGKDEDRATLNTSARCGNNMYTARFDKQEGFMFMVSNVLEYKNITPNMPSIKTKPPAVLVG